MKTTSIVARYLLGLMFTVFGLNGFLNFIHQPPPTNPLALQFLAPSSHRTLPRSSSRGRCLVGCCCSSVDSCHLR
jgi:hypothetical protein